MDTKIYYQHTILASEITATNKVSPYQYVQIMQEASMLSARKLKVSFLESRTWILIRKDIHFLRYPSLGETIKVLTYPAGFDRVFAFRDYKVYDQDENLIAHASSTWLLMDAGTRKMIKLPKEILDIEVPANEVLLKRPIKNRQTIQKSEYTNTYTVQFFDIDWNDHANNNFLIKSMLEGAPIKFLQHLNLKSMQVEFKKECKLGDKLYSLCEKESEFTTLHELRKKDSDELVVMGKCNWQKA